jgi:HK97 family phage major capsid protein
MGNFQESTPMNLHAVREARAAKVAEARTLLASSPTLTPEAQTKFDAIKAEIVNLEGQEARAQFVEDAERRSLGTTVHKSESDMEGRASLLEAIRCQVEGRSATGAVAEYSREVEQRTGQKGVFVPMSAFESRAQTTTTAAGIVPPDFKQELFVGPLRNSLVMRSLGARVLTGLRGDVVIPKHKTSMTAGWIAEGESLSETGMTFETMGLAPRTVGALTEMSLRLIQQSSPQIDQLVRDDMSAIIAEAFDTAMLTGDGIKQPLGLLGTPGTQTGALATLDWPAVLEMLEKLAVVNVNPSAWLTSPAVATKLRSILKSASAGAGYLMENGSMAGLPVAVSNQVPLAATKGQVVLANFSEMFVGVWDSIQILVNPYDSAAYARGGVKVRAMLTADSAVRRPEAFVIASDVTV